MMGFSPVSVKTIVSVISFWKRQKSPSKDTLLYTNQLAHRSYSPWKRTFETWTRSSQNEQENHLPSIHLHDFKIQNPWVFGSVWPNICWPPFFHSKISPLVQLPKEKLDMKLEISRMILLILQPVWYEWCFLVHWSKNWSSLIILHQSAPKFRHTICCTFYFGRKVPSHPFQRRLDEWSYVTNLKTNADSRFTTPYKVGPY